ncbi:MAG: hypothetical protein LC620_07835, partial [Halobacteriales archaeon]|nr:hypothetical protein [Halobacteriales archaeon]
MPEGAPGQVRARVRSAVARIVPPVFLGVGIVYLTACPFLPFTLAGTTPYALGFAAACAVMGLGLVWFARQARRGRIPVGQVQPLAAILLAAVSTQAILYNLLLPGQPTMASLLMLTAGAGLVVVERRLYFPLVAFLLVEWGLLFFLAPDPSSAQT